MRFDARKAPPEPVLAEAGLLLSFVRFDPGARTSLARRLRVVLREPASARRRQRRLSSRRGRICLRTYQRVSPPDSRPGAAGADVK